MPVVPECRNACTSVFSFSGKHPQLRRKGKKIKTSCNVMIPCFLRYHGLAGADSEIIYDCVAAFF